MKPKPPHKKMATLPKPRVMTGVCHHRMVRSVHLKPHPAYAFSWETTCPVLVLPCSSASEAKARLRWEKLSYEEKFNALRDVLLPLRDDTRDQAWAVLKLLNLQGTK